MINYTVKSGDTLSALAYKYQTTIQIIMSDNPVIKSKDKIQVGWTLKIRSSEEYAKAKAQAAQKAAKTGSQVSQTVAPASSKVQVDNNYNWKGIPVANGQIGLMVANGNVWMYTINSKNALVQKKQMKKGDSYRVYAKVSTHGGLYDIGASSFVKQTEVTFSPIPSNYVSNPSPGSSIDAEDAIWTRDPVKQTPTTSTSSVSNIPQFQRPGYRRPVLQVKSGSSTTTMELRVDAVGRGYSNQIQPNRTNAGWLVNVMGQNLPTLNISGYFLDSRYNREMTDFMDRYKKYFIPGKSGKYYSMAIATFLYKNVEYKGLIGSLNVSEQAAEPITSRFNMQFIVLSEKSLSTSEIDKIPKIVNRGGVVEANFLSDLVAMLTNPITGRYGTD